MKQRTSFRYLVSQMPRTMVLLVLVLCCSCMGSQNHSGEKQKQRKEIPLETLIRINRSLVEKEQTQIKSYIQEHNLEMTQTGTGLWYHVEQIQEGPFVKKGQVVELNYKVSLLDGTECYNSDSLGVKSFLVGQGGVENGLEEGVLLLKKGSRASFIMAPHLAHGLMGDDDKIPARAILFYEVEVLNVKGQ